MNQSPFHWSTERWKVLPIWQKRFWWLHDIEHGWYAMVDPERTRLLLEGFGKSKEGVNQRVDQMRQNLKMLKGELIYFESQGFHQSVATQHLKIRTLENELHSLGTMRSSLQPYRGLRLQGRRAISFQMTCFLTGVLSNAYKSDSFARGLKSFLEDGGALDSSLKEIYQEEKMGLGWKILEAHAKKEGARVMPGTKLRRRLVYRIHCTPDAPRSWMHHLRQQTYKRLSGYGLSLRDSVRDRDNFELLASLGQALAFDEEGVELINEQRRALAKAGGYED